MKLSKHSIFLVIPTLEQGGSERVMSVLANTWAEDNHNVHLVLLAEAERFYELNKNVNVTTLNFKNTGRVNKKYHEISVFLKLRQLLKKERPDFVLSFGLRYNIITILASRFLNLRVFVSDRHNPNRQEVYSIDILRRITYRFADGIIAQTQLAKKTLQKSTNNNNIKVIPNPIKNIVTYSDLKRDNIILNVGRLVPDKGQKYLIDVFSDISNKDWKLVILGEGPLKNKLKLQIENAGIKERVYMPGAVQNVDEWLSKASVFAFSSLSEGFPNALVEAMSSGLPCISFDCDSGPRDIIENGKNGFLVKTKDVDEFRKVLEKMIKNKSLREKIGAEAKKTTNKFNVINVANQYLSFCLKS